MKIKVWLLTILLTLGNLSISIAAPSPPFMSYSTNGINLNISWTSVPDATGYTLYYAPSPYVGPKTIQSIDMGTKTSFSANLWDGAEFFIAVKARNGQGESGYSNIEKVAVLQLNKKWRTYLSDFINDDERVPPNFIDKLENDVSSDAIEVYEAASLRSSVPSDSDISGKEAIIFINGFLVGDNLGGGKGTWGVFPQRLQTELGSDFISFEFRWRTNARFQDVAADLQKAIDLVSSKTGKNVHIVAHSFGGLLARTYLQGFAGYGGSLDSPSIYTTPVASLTTLGTPHSGIADSRKNLHWLSFPDGQDADIIFNAAGQVSVHQAGENALFSINHNLENLRDDAGNLYIQDEPGELIKALETSSFLKENLPVQVLIGLAYDVSVETGGTKVTFTARHGDGLISYDGQRFYLGYTGPLVTEEIIHNAKVTERVLGNLTPGQLLSFDDLDKTYNHSAGIGGVALPGRAKHHEVYVGRYEAHEGFRLAKEWILRHRGTTPPLTTFNTVTVAGYVWMDRNLGASRVATSPTDQESFGDLYQWGRGADGHQRRNSSITSSTSSSDMPGHGDFITTSSSPDYGYNWRVPQNASLWQGVNGINNPCPPGFRVPTLTEWKRTLDILNITDGASAYASPLKLVLAGTRSPDSGDVYGESEDRLGAYWTSELFDEEDSWFQGHFAKYLNIWGKVHYNETYIADLSRGNSVRCIQD